MVKLITEWLGTTFHHKSEKDYDIIVYARVVIGFDMEVQPFVTHNAAWPLCVRAFFIDVVSNHLLFAQMPWALLA